MKVAAIVITYNPDPAEVERNIKQYIDVVDRVIVWRNSADDFVFKGEGAEKVVYMGAGENEYIAKPLNRAIDWCLDNGVEWLLTMDQDSTWMDFAGFLEKVKEQDHTQTIVYAPSVNCHAVLENEANEVESVITSGALHHVGRTKMLGGFREDYQIYWVDGEFCYWSRMNGYKVKVLRDFEMKQQFGRESKGPFGVSIANYSPLVYYYLFRNMIWMRREFRKGVSSKTMMYTSFIYVRSIVLGEKQKVKKLFHVVKGMVDGVFRSYMPRIKSAS